MPVPTGPPPRGRKKASADDTLALTGQMIGGVTVLDLPAALAIWVDARVMTRRQIIVGGGSRSCKVLLDPQALLGLPGVEVVEGLAVPVDPPR